MFQQIRIGKEWNLSPTLVSHNCHGEKYVNTNWSHTSRFDEPLVCRGCGKRCPEDIEAAFRTINRYYEKFKPISVRLLEGRVPER